ncbi:ATP synthase subunit I [Saccharophagus degradans]|nr:ATP synthase subunit I [Saccharophagus degradans]
MLVQLACVIPLSLIGFLVHPLAAKSFLLGAIVYMLPNLYFTYYAFRYRGAQAARWIARSFSWGQSGKLALAAVGFALVFRFVQPLQVEFLFIGFGFMVVLQWFIGLQVAKNFRL